MCGGFMALSTLEACSTLPMYKSKTQNGLIEVPLAEFGAGNSIIVRNNDLDFDVLVLKDGVNYRALYMQCTHEAAPLTATEKGLYCSMHGSAFDLTGKVTKDPATKPLTKFEVTQSNGTLLINPNKQVI